MKIYRCQCQQIIFFENNSCVNCHRELGFLPDLLCLSSLEPDEEGQHRATNAAASGRRYRKCKNYNREVICNWMIPEDQDVDYCISCQLDEIIPDLTIPRNRTLWKAIEVAKRRLIYTLISLHLPLLNRLEDPEQGLSFRFLADGPTPESRVLTGHEQGVITLNIAEADDGEREKRRISMKEPYRTLLGHFRHESGHYYWDRLIANTHHLEAFRRTFGDEQEDYQKALKRYYTTGAPSNWQDNFISVYATAHPWEDWAECWAHYLHIQDTLEVANNFGLVEQHLTLHIETRNSNTQKVSQKTFEKKIEAWAELSIALNSLNRSMGLKDIYPFILSPTVVDKLRFISEVISEVNDHSALIKDEARRALPLKAEEARSVTRV